MTVLLESGARANLRDVGAGSPVLFLHGNPDTGELWDRVLSTLATRHRCLAPDLPGFGGSEVPAAFDYSLEGLAAWVDGLRRALGISQPLDLVVHDFGGLFGIAWAVRHPQHVRRLVIMNTVFFPDYRWHFWARVWRTPLLGELSFLVNTRWALALEMRRGSKRLPAAHAQRAFAAMTPTMTRTVLRLYRAADPQGFAPWQDGLRALIAQVPALVLWGDRDPYIGKAFAERFGAREVHHFPHAGHWLPVEESDAVAAHLLAFLA
jgi:pimeloyl-ACP methyl ester carboxylesterase